MEFARYIFTVALGLLTVFMSTKETEWKATYRPWIMLCAFLLTAGLVITTWSTDMESKNKLITALQKLDDKSERLETEMRAGTDRVIATQQENITLEKQNFALQKELTEKAELARKRGAAIQAKKEADQTKREKEFIAPLSAFIMLGEGYLRGLNSSPEGGVKIHQEYAPKWLWEVDAFFRSRCTDEQVIAGFRYPPQQGSLGPFSAGLGEEFREKYPALTNPAFLPLVAFYEYRLVFLRRYDFSSCR